MSNNKVEETLPAESEVDGKKGTKRAAEVRELSVNIALACCFTRGGPDYNRYTRTQIRASGPARHLNPLRMPGIFSWTG